MSDIQRKANSIDLSDFNAIPESVLRSTEPVVLKGVVKHWPLVKLGKVSDKAAMDYLKVFYNGKPTIVCQTEARAKGRLYYDESLTKLDYVSYKGRIDDVLDSIYDGIGKDDSPGYYIASNLVETHFPGLGEDNGLVVPREKSLDVSDETVSIWIGSQTTATCHYDSLDNIACCVVGRRRFTLFPPNQVKNLYPGPLEPTPGGQVISLVDFNNPDFDLFPGFRDALDQALIVELEPGDGLFLPSMWWHHVEGLSPFNLLVNYWWNDAPRYLSSGMNAMYMAMLGIRDKPKHEREAWKHLFDYYIFGGAKIANEKIPKEARGFLENLDNLNARKLRALLINQLNR